METGKDREQAEPTQHPEFELLEYSEKAIVIYGDTRRIKDKLKDLGGRFNPHLNRNGAKVAGWIFPKAKTDIVKAELFS